MIRVGIGGWNYAPWRGAFYPEDLPRARELAHASRALTTIEINSTFYRSQKPATFRRWAEETPEDFVFSVKAPRYAAARKALREAGPVVENFIGGGVLELGDKLGPILWQIMPAKTFDAEEMRAFFALLPPAAGSRRLRHVVEVRHESFQCAEFVELARASGIAIAFVESEKHAPIADPTADFVYGRLERTSAAEPAGYPRAEIRRWAERARAWQKGDAPDDLPRLNPTTQKTRRDVFVYFIGGAKERAPAAALALIETLGTPCG